MPFVPETEQETYRRFLRDMADKWYEKFKRNYSDFERAFIFRNKDRDIETYPYTDEQIKSIKMMMDKYCKRM